MRKFFKGLVVALALTTLVGTAFAEPVFTFKGSGLTDAQPWGASADENYVVPVEGLDLSKVDKITFSLNAEGTNGNGGFGFDTKNTENFSGSEWEQDTKADENGNYWTKYKFNFGEGTTEVSIEGLEGLIENTTMEIQLWWINSIQTTEDDEDASLFTQDWGPMYAKPGVVTLESITLYDKDGNVVVAEDAPAADSTTGSTDSTDAADTTTDSSKETGEATSIVVLAVIALAAMSGAVVVSKKRA